MSRLDLGPSTTVFLKATRRGASLMRLHVVLLREERLLATLFEKSMGSPNGFLLYMSAASHLPISPSPHRHCVNNLRL